MTRRILGLLAVLSIVAIPLSAQQASQPAAKPAPAGPEMRPALLDAPMMDFTLPSYQGGDVTLSKYKGKNVMIIFPRGYAAPDYWCTICNYRYAELLNLEQTKGVRKAYDMEVLVVLPYDAQTVATWVKILPEQLEKIKAAKNPPDPSKLDEAGKRRMERWRQIFPNDYSFPGNQAPTPFPILIDADRTVSKTLGLFQTEWNGGKVDQNIPSVFIVDKAGVLKFKYLAQTTVDRPSYDYLFKILNVINAGRL